MAYEVLRRIHLLHDQRGNDLSWGIFKPDHKWNNFEHNSQLPQTERKGRKSWRVLEDWMHGEPRWALLTVVTKKASGSCVAVCNSSFFERGYRTLPTEGFCLFVCFFLVDPPILITTMHTSPQWKNPVQALSKTDAVFPHWKGRGENLQDLLCIWGQLLTELILKLRRYRNRSGKMWSQLNTVSILTLPVNSGEGGIWGRQADISCCQ